VNTPLGSGYALFVEFTAHDYFWTVALDNGAPVTFTQDRIRFARCYTRRRGLGDDEMRAIVAAACRPAKNYRPPSRAKSKRRRT